MIYRRYGDKIAVRIDRGEEVIEQLTKVLAAEGVRAGYVTALGATNDVTFGLYSIETGVYDKQTLTGDMEIVSLVGNVSEMDGKPYIHLHIGVCDKDMILHGGHLTACRISVTCELFLTVLDGVIDRKRDPELGINLIQLD
ncbi:MAG: DNA-binding protein [Clostridia bacterium]|nr:DNA-binding protein [Clostridia bacterium]